MTVRTLAAIVVSAVLGACLAAQAPSPRKPASPAEAAALKSLMSTFNDATTSANLLDGAITNFRLQYPKSDYTVPILVDAVRFARIHGDYLHLLDYGAQVLALAPHNLYTLSALGAAIPDNVKQSDLDRDQRLAQASAYDEEVIATMSGLVVMGDSVVFKGEKYTAAQATQLKRNLLAPAYVSLGRIASLQQRYAQAAENFRAALPLERELAAQAQVHFDLGQAEAAAGNTAAAQADFDQALKLAPNSPLLDRLVRLERSKLAGGGGQ